MNREEFQDALRKGLGRTVQHVRNSPPEMVREDLLHACLNSLAWDQQCECSRAPWLYKMIELTGQKDYYRSNIFEKYRANFSDIVRGNDSRQLQLFHLIEEFAKQGDPEARNEVLRFFERQFDLEVCIEGFIGWFIGGDTIIAMDGIPGLLYVVERFGKRIKDGEDIVLTPCLVEDAEKILGKSEVENALRIEALRNEFIKIYLDHPETNRELVDAENAKDRNVSDEERAKRGRQKYPLRKLTNLFLKDDFSMYVDDEQFLKNPYDFCRDTNYKFHISGKWATEKNLSYVYDKILELDDPFRKAVLLRTFLLRALPKVDEKFLALLDSDDNHVAQHAEFALSNTHHPMVREKALKLLRMMPTPPNWFWGIDLLENNFQEEDITLLDTAIRTKHFPDNWDVERTGISIEKIYDKHPSEKFAEVFLWYYENGPCSFCREGFVDRLQKMNRLPVEIREECRDDCNPGIRELVDAQT